MTRSSVILVVIALIATACGGAATPTTAPPTATAAPTKTPLPVTKVVVSYSNIIGDELPLWIAKEGGYLLKNGIDAGDLQNIASAQGVPALISGQVQFGQLGGSEVLSAAAVGADLVVIGMLAGVYPFVFVVPPEIKTKEDLRGKSVGVSAFGSSSDIATRVGLRSIGIDPDKDVTIVPVGSLQNRVAALLSGSIKGGVVTPPETLQFEEKGFKVLFDLSGLPSANTAVVVKKTYLDANRDLVQRYVDSLVQAIAREKADRAFSIQVLKQYYKSTDDRAMGVAYDFFSAKIAVALPFPKPEQFRDAQTTLGATNDKVKSFDIAKLIDSSFMQSAANRGLDKQP